MYRSTQNILTTGQLRIPRKHKISRTTRLHLTRHLFPQPHRLHYLQPQDSKFHHPTMNPTTTLPNPTLRVLLVQTAPRPSCIPLAPPLARTPTMSTRTAARRVERLRPITHLLRVTPSPLVIPHRAGIQSVRQRSRLKQRPTLSNG